MVLLGFMGLWKARKRFDCGGGSCHALLLKIGSGADSERAVKRRLGADIFLIAITSCQWENPRNEIYESRPPRLQ